MAEHPFVGHRLNGGTSDHPTKFQNLKLGFGHVPTVGEWPSLIAPISDRLLHSWISEDPKLDQPPFDLALKLIFGQPRAAPAFAAGSNMPWEQPLSQILDSVQGPVAKVISHLVVRETEFCGQRLAGDFSRRMRENGRNSVSQFRRGAGASRGSGHGRAATAPLRPCRAPADGLGVGVEV